MVFSSLVSHVLFTGYRAGRRLIQGLIYGLVLKRQDIVERVQGEAARYQSP